MDRALLMVQILEEGSCRLFKDKVDEIKRWTNKHFENWNETKKRKADGYESPNQRPLAEIKWKGRYRRREEEGRKRPTDRLCILMGNKLFSRTERETEKEHPLLSDGTETSLCISSAPPLKWTFPFLTGMDTTSKMEIVSDISIPTATRQSGPVLPE